MDNKVDGFKNFLKNITDIDDDVLDLSNVYLTTSHLKKNEYFVREGQLCQEIAFINKGLFRIFYLKDGIEINTCFCLENSITSSFSSFINRIPAIENIQALEDSELLVLSHSNLKKLYELSPQWQVISRLLTEKECLRLSDRAESLSFESAREKYRNLFARQPQVIKRVPVQHIASYLGVTRETLSRIRSQK